MKAITTLTINPSLDNLPQITQITTDFFASL
ncbi:hypothetical protein DFR66_103132 [Flavobacterium glaciei]|uniref:1-phosphofructokinase n=1 Tax=Flavobacterium glaciei TaxID=386300 RepID=A0ABX9HZN7_9FLAO|nr:hypothetical protein DFR66_103132 [Flavobacterium glaciei]